MDEQAVSTTTVESTTTGQESAPAQQTTQDTSVLTGENQSNTNTVESGSQGKSNSIPYDRFKEVNDRLRQAEDRARQLETKAMLVDKLKSDPMLAQAFLSEAQVSVGDPTLTEADKTLASMGYVKASDVEKKIQETFTRIQIEQELRGKFNEAAKMYDGSNGAPKFNEEQVRDFMMEKGVYDPKVAFEIMHSDALADWRAKQKRSTAYTEQPGQPMQTSAPSNKNDREEAKRTGDWQSYILKNLTPKLE